MTLPIPRAPVRRSLTAFAIILVDFQAAQTVVALAPTLHGRGVASLICDLTVSLHRST